MTHQHLAHPDQPGPDSTPADDETSCFIGRGSPVRVAILLALAEQPEGMTSLELTHRVRQRHAFPPNMLLARCSDLTQRALYRLQIDGMVAKPHSATRVVNAIWFSPIARAAAEIRLQARLHAHQPATAPRRA